MAKYVYSRYVLITNYTEEFLKEELDAISSNLNKYGDYSINQSAGLFNVERLISNNTFDGFLVSSSSAPSTFGTSLTAGKFLGKTKDGTNISYRTLDIFSLKTNYSRGTYVDDIIADEGTYPVNGRQGSYWYVRGEKYAPLPLVNVDGVWKEPTEGYVKVDGVWRPIAESLVRAGGIWRTSV